MREKESEEIELRRIIKVYERRDKIANAQNESKEL